MNEQPSLNETQAPESQRISRREFLGWSARLAAIMAVVRSGLTPRSARAASVDSSFSQTAPETPLTPEDLISQELEKAVRRVAILDIGTMKEGKVAALSKSETWLLLTGEEKSEEDIEVLEASQDPLARLITAHLYYGEHGKNVTDAFEKSELYFSGKKASTQPDFRGVEPQTLSGPFLKIIQTESFETPVPTDEYLAVFENRIRGQRFSIEVDFPPEVLLPEKGKIVSCSWQTGKMWADVMTEWGTRANVELSLTDIAELIRNFTDGDGRYLRQTSSQDDPHFIFPAGTSQQDIASIKVIEWQEEPVEHVFTFDSEGWSQAEDKKLERGFRLGGSTGITDETAPEIAVEITLKDGRQISGNTNPTEEDYDYEYKSPEASDKWQVPSIKGAFQPENPDRQNNLDQLAEYLRQHPDHFFVMALGNHGDQLSDEDVALLPQNAIFVGQLASAQYVQGHISTFPYGDTWAGEKSPFVKTYDMGINGQGSSFAVPVISLVIAQLYREQQVIPNRDDVLEKLTSGGYLQAPNQDSSEVVQPDFTVLDIEKVKDLFTLERKSPAQFSRRNLFRGRIRE